MEMKPPVSEAKCTTHALNSSSNNDGRSEGCVPITGVTVTTVKSETSMSRNPKK